LSTILAVSTAPSADAGWQPVAADRIVSGTPSTRTRIDYSSPGDGFHAGMWEATAGAWRVQYGESELCTILAGSVRLTDAADGSVVVYGPGESFVVPTGFTGIWEVIEPVQKLFAIGMN
jgi:uncharacterized cupin superfamily protein